MSWKAEYVFLIFISTLLAYVTAIQMKNTDDSKKRKRFLLYSIVGNLGILFFFKYYNFVGDSLRAFLAQFTIIIDVPTLKLLLPVGISFYTFQTLSYSIDVYKKKIEPEKHFGIFALYVSFFPQLVAGPIERATNLLPQFFKEHLFDGQKIFDGLRLMLWGFFLKIMIADKLAISVDYVYNNVTEFTGLPLIIATYYFSFQIYCDFAGYSFIAIGAAKILGFDLMENFRRPYFSQSIGEFWRRWHISLFTWFKDYIYIPLGGNKVSKIRWCINIMIVFLVSGIWHGAAWTFIIWGIIHGFYSIFAIITQKIRKKIVKIFFLTNVPRFQTILQIFTTFHLVLFSWIFFRANSLADAKYIITHMFSDLHFENIETLLLGLTNNTEFAIVLFAILVMELIHVLQEQITNLNEKFLKLPIWIRWTFYYALIFAILLFGEFDQSAFIYFQF